MYGGDKHGGLESIFEDFCDSHVDSFVEEGKDDDDGSGFSHSMHYLHEAYLTEFEKACEWAIEVEGGTLKTFFETCQVRDVAKLCLSPYGVPPLHPSNNNMPRASFSVHKSPSKKDFSLLFCALFLISVWWTRESSSTGAQIPIWPGSLTQSLQRWTFRPSFE